MYLGINHWVSLVLILKILLDPSSYVRGATIVSVICWRTYQRIVETIGDKQADLQLENRNINHLEERMLN